VGTSFMFEVEREQIRRWIEERVAQHWEATGHALLLSKLGGPIKREFPNSSTIMEVKFSDFVRSCPGVRIVEHPLIREKIGAVPLGAKTPHNAAELFVDAGPDSGSSSSSSAPGPYFSPNFWKAFHTPMNGRRFVIPPDESHPLRIVDREPAEGEHGYEVLESDLTLLPTEVPLTEKVRSVAAKIRAWLARYDLSDQPFRDRIGTRTISREIQSPAEMIAKSKLSLSEALANLHPSEQARISVPLDIVLKMLSGR